MREIKFRAWDKKNKIMRQGVWSEDGGIWGDIYYYMFLGCDGKISVYKDEDDGKNGLYEHKSREFDLIPLLYTGLKDKNGKEIYEGDVIKRTGEYAEKGEWGIVEFVGGCFLLNRNAFIKKHGHTEYLQWSTEAFEDCEVIGNLYDNPELLEN